MRDDVWFIHEVDSLPEIGTPADGNSFTILVSFTSDISTDQDSNHTAVSSEELMEELMELH